jgi:cytochrome P450
MTILNFPDGSSQHREEPRIDLLWDHVHERLMHVESDDFHDIAIQAQVTDSGGTVNAFGYDLSPSEARDIAASLLIAAHHATPCDCDCTDGTCER